MTRFYEDVDVGETREVSAVEMTTEEIKRFATRYDPQAIHLDEGRAEDSNFEGIIASGFHTLAAVNGVVTEEYKRDLALVAGLELEHVRWHRPVRPDDAFTPTIEVVDKRPLESKDDEGLIRFEVEAVDQDVAPVISFVDVALIERDGPVES